MRVAREAGAARTGIVGSDGGELAQPAVSDHW